MTPPPPPSTSTFQSHVLNLISTPATSYSYSVVQNDPVVQSTVALLLREVSEEEQRHNLQLLGLGGLASDALATCKDLKAHDRLSRLLTTAVIIEVENKIKCSGAEGSSSSSNGDDAAEGNNLRALCQALCDTLGQSRNQDITQRSASELMRKKMFFAWLHKEFTAVSTRKPESSASFGAIYTALSLLSLFIDSRHEMTTTTASIQFYNNHKQMTRTFLSTIIHPATDLSYPSDLQMKMSHSFLLLAVTQSLFDTMLVRVLGLSLRMHPERGLPLAEAIFSSFAAANPRISPIKIDVSSHLVKEEDDIYSHSLLPSVIGQLKSMKAEMRDCAWRTLILLAQLSGDEGNSPNPSKSVELVTREICKTLRLGRTLSCTPDQRVGAYIALEGVARYILISSPILSPSLLMAKLTNTALGALATSLSEDESSLVDAAAYSSSSEPPFYMDDLPTELANTANTDDLLTSKEVGLRALLMWMQISNHDLSSGWAIAGYATMLDYLAEPIVKYSVKGDEFRFRIGSLIETPQSNDLVRLIKQQARSPIEAFGETFFESVVSKLLQKKIVQEGLITVIDTAVKNHASTDAVPQVDGVLAILLLVVYRDNNLSSLPSSSSSFAIPEQVLEVVNAGATARGASFLYSPAILEVAQSDALVHYALHRIIALHYKATWNAKEGSGSAIEVNDPLVRIIDNPMMGGFYYQCSAAARALAICMVYPYRLSSTLQPAGFLVKFSTVTESVNLVLVNSPSTEKTADTIIFAMFSHGNEVALNFEPSSILQKQPGVGNDYFTPMKDSRASRTIWEQGRPLPVGYYAIVRTLQPHLSQSDAMIRAMLLIHTTGDCMKKFLRRRDLEIREILRALQDSTVDDMAERCASFLAVCVSSSQWGPRPTRENDLTVAHDNDCLANISLFIYDAAKNLLTTLGEIAGQINECDERHPLIDGGIASNRPFLRSYQRVNHFRQVNVNDENNFLGSFASILCTKKIPVYLSSCMSANLVTLGSFTEADLYLSRISEPIGIDEDIMIKSKCLQTLTDKDRALQTADDMEMMLNYVQETALEVPCSHRGKESLFYNNKQALHRVQEFQVVKEDFLRTLVAIQCLCQSHTDVANSVIPLFGHSIIAAAFSSCPAFNSIDELQNQCFTTLSALTLCASEEMETLRYLMIELSHQILQQHA